MSKVQRLSAILVVGLWVSAVSIGQPQAPSAAGPAVPDAYGPGDQVLHIAAAAFQPASNHTGYSHAEDGYIYYSTNDYFGWFVANLGLPPGAEIWGICTYFFDTAPGESVRTILQAVKLAVGSIGPGVIPIYGPFSEDYDGGYGVSCSNSSYILRDTGDIDGDGSSEDVVHRLKIEMYEDGPGNLGFGGVRVFWRRKVSPAPAVADFADVPTGHPYFQFVEALFGSGITGGCGGGNYCPDAFLTRGQMAVFLSKALGLHWAY